MMLFTTGIVVLVLVFFAYFAKADVPPVAGIYRQPGKWYYLKLLIFKTLYWLRSRQKKRQTVSSEKPGKTIKGYGHGDDPEQMELPQTVSSHPDSIDTCFFGGTDKNGCSVIFRMARRTNRRAEVWLFMDIPGFGCVQHPRHPDVDVAFTDGQSFRAGGLHFEMIEPMKKWRVRFSGKLRKGLCNDLHSKPEEYVETSFSFIWSAFTQPFSSDTDMSADVLGDCIAREIWSKKFFQRLKQNHQSHYDQWGELRGTLNLEGQDSRQLCLQTVRDHSYGTRDWRHFHRYIFHYIYVETGMTVIVGIFSQPNLMSHVKVGHISYANGDKVALSDIHLNIWEIGEETKTVPETWSFSFVADGQIYNVEATAGKSITWYHHEDRGGKVVEVFTTFKVNSFSARGNTEFFFRNYDGPSYTPVVSCSVVSEPSVQTVNSNMDKLVLFFTDEACSSPSLVGGKGAQLAQLTSIQNEVNATVPPGFCLTLAAFEKQLKVHKDIDAAIKELNVSTLSKSDNLSLACEKLVSMITQSDLCSEVEKGLLDELKTITGDEISTTHFAVRSSAAGEDGSEASSAGQMDTILGVVGIKQIIEAVKKCWASVYTLQAVEYRKQHGQPTCVSVGVVIQEMVPASSAGVIFTCDPITGSYTSMVINANYGLGESVVSGKVDPDTIYIARHPEFVYDSEHLTISNTRKGEKKIKLKETGFGGLIEETISDAEKNALCLSEKMLIQLATLGLELEKRFGSPRDIEWAIAEDQIFMLQCRPVTVLDSETEWDLLHEFDSPMTCDYLWLTTSNISEMMPGAVTPLSMSTFMPSVEYGLQTLNHYLGARKVPTHLPKFLPSCCGHLFICMTEVTSIIHTVPMVRKDVAEISLLGSMLKELTEEQILDYLGCKPGFFKRLLNFISMLRMWNKAASVTAEWEKKIPSYKIGENATCAQELYDCINGQLKDYETVWVWTLINSGRSGNWTTILMSIIGGDASTWSNDLYGDIALLLSHCDDVYSAEVPHAIEGIAFEISKDSAFRDKFLQTPDTECLDLLQENNQVKDMVDSFLKRHGHRCIRESELREKSWKSAPEKFISVLKMVVKTIDHVKKKKEAMSIDELMENLKTKLPFLKKQIIKYLLPKAWVAVGAREWGKSVSVRMSEVFKLAYNRLGMLMFQEGRLPDPDLLYFLTHREIGTVLATRSARLIIKAQRRRKILALQAGIKFPRLCRSYPQPVEDKKDSDDNAKAVSLIGTPVSQGVIKGPAQVVHSLEEAHVIQEGDILVVKSTDVGWSPYFPLIGGLVTELGGLISHGAVVAREYGIPCVVNVANATSIITTGEKIELDGRKGIVKRLNITEANVE